MDDWGSAWGEELHAPLANLSLAQNIQAQKSPSPRLHGFDPFDGVSPWISGEASSIDPFWDGNEQSRAKDHDQALEYSGLEQDISKAQNDDSDDFVWGEEQEGEFEHNGNSWPKSSVPTSPDQASQNDENDVEHNTSELPKEIEKVSASSPAMEEIFDVEALESSSATEVICEAGEPENSSGVIAEDHLESMPEEAGAVRLSDGIQSTVPNEDSDVIVPENQEEIQDDDDFGEFEEIEEHPTAGNVAGDVVNSAHSVLFHDAQDSNSAEALSKADFPMDMSYIEKLFPPEIKESKPLSDVRDEIISSTSNRKIWYRITRKETMREESIADESNYIKVKWIGSKIQEDVNKIVGKWIADNRSHRGFGFGFGLHNGARARNIFKWSENSKDLGHGMKRSRSHTATSRSVPPLLGPRHRHHQSLAPDHLPLPGTNEPPQTFGAYSQPPVQENKAPGPGRGSYSSTENGAGNFAAGVGRLPHRTQQARPQPPQIPSRASSLRQSSSRPSGQFLGRAGSVDLRRGIHLSSSRSRTSHSVDLSALQPRPNSAEYENPTVPLSSPASDHSYERRLPGAARADTPHLPSHQLDLFLEDGFSALQHQRHSQSSAMPSSAMEFSPLWELASPGSPAEASAVSRPSSDLAALTESPLPDSPMESITSASSPLAAISPLTNHYLNVDSHSMSPVGPLKGSNINKIEKPSPIMQNPEDLIPPSSVKMTEGKSKKEEEEQEEIRIVRSIIAGLPDLSYMLG